MCYLKGGKYFSALDISSGYYTIKCDKDYNPKSIVTTVFGKFDFLKYPFGLSPGPNVFIWLFMIFPGLEKMSNQSQGSGYFSNLDYILIYSKTEINTY